MFGLAVMRVERALIPHCRWLQAMYNGQGLRIDGHFKQAKTIVQYRAASRGKRDRPYSCLFAICGTDGSLLAPVVPLRGEAWEDIAPVLRQVFARIVSVRQSAGFSLSEAMPVFIATDSYRKHRNLLQSLARSVGEQLRISIVGSTPKGLAVTAQISQCDSHPADDVTLIAGEPFHDVINARRLASPNANDCLNFLYDHQDTLCRLNAKPAPVKPPGIREAAPMLSEAGCVLLQSAVRKHKAAFLADRGADPPAAAEMKAFLAHAQVRLAKPVWKRCFRAQPPGGVVARLARLCGAQLAESCDYWNYHSASDFVREVKRMKKWYKVGRRLSRRRRGLLRVKAATSMRVKGRASVWTRKLSVHYRRLLAPTRVEGLMAWRRCALALHMAGIATYSGTLPVERFWSWFRSCFPPSQRNVCRQTWDLLASMAFLRYTWSHFNKPVCAAWTRKDTVLAQHAAEMLEMLRAAEDGRLSPIEVELAEALRAFGHDERPAKRQRRE